MTLLSNNAEETTPGPSVPTSGDHDCSYRGSGGGKHDAEDMLVQQGNSSLWNRTN